MAVIGLEMIEQMAEALDQASRPRGKSCRARGCDDAPASEDADDVDKDSGQTGSEQDIGREDSGVEYSGCVDSGEDSGEKTNSGEREDSGGKDCGGDNIREGGENYDD